MVHNNITLYNYTYVGLKVRNIFGRNKEFFVYHQNNGGLR